MEDSNILDLAVKINQGNCVNKDCDKEIKELVNLIDKHNEYCGCYKIHFNEYFYDEKIKKIFIKKVVSRYISSRNESGSIDMVEKRSGY
jgi:hypothetical protein